MKRTILFFACLLSLITISAQTGPWAKYDDKMKGEALIRDSDGGYLKEVQSIVEGGGDVNWQLQPSGLTALMAAASGGKTDVVAFLLKSGAVRTLKDASGMTALDRAIVSNATEVIKLLSPSIPAPVNQDPVPVVTEQPSIPTIPTKQEPIAETEIPVTPPVQPVAIVPATYGRYTKWAPFGSYKVGDEVFFFNGRWNKGKIKEVGTLGDYAVKRAGSGEREYLIAREGAPNWNDWTAWGRVTGMNRENFWTDYFIGNWSLGEVMAVNTHTDGNYQRDEYSFHAATEALDVKANNTYRWKILGGKVINGAWKAAADGAGIVLQKGFQGRDWTMRNETNATEENIRAIQSARLTTEGKMSIKGKRPL